MILCDLKLTPKRSRSKTFLSSRAGFITSEWADITLKHAINTTTYIKCPVLLTSHVGGSSRRPINLHIFSLNHSRTLKVWLTSHTHTTCQNLNGVNLAMSFGNAES